jgi:hypothetical protein
MRERPTACDALPIDSLDPTANRFWRAETGIFLAVWLGILTVGRTQSFRDPGTLWHVVVGEQILSSGRFVTVDPFSFTYGGRPWISQKWLAECAMALVHRATGLDGLLLAMATLLAALYTWAAHRLIRAGMHWLLAILFLALAFGASTFHFHPRPHLATIVLLGWSFALLCDFEAGRIPLERLSWLVPAFLLWSNAHDGVLGGLATLGVTVAGWGLFRVMGPSGPIQQYGQIVRLLALVGLCSLTIVVNPYGLAGPRAALELVGSPVLPRLIDEHGPLLARSTGPMILPMAAVYLAILVSVPPRQYRVTWLVPLLWLALAFTRIRHGPLFAITALIALADVFPKSSWAARLVRSGSDLYRLPASGLATRGTGTEHSRRLSLFRAGLRPALLPIGVVLASLVLQLSGARVPVLGRGWVRLDRAYWPVDLLPELREYERQHPPGTPIFNELLFGGFLIYHTPGLRVFIDDRCELYGDRWLLDYVDAQSDHPDRVDSWATRYGIDFALVQAGSSFDRYLEEAPGWIMVRRVRTAAIYKRDTFQKPVEEGRDAAPAPSGENRN